MAAIVYILCALTSGACTILLLGRYRRSRAPMLFWSGACFLAFTTNNILLFIDLIVLPQIDLSLWRSLTILAGLILLIYGLMRPGGET